MLPNCVFVNNLSASFASRRGRLLFTIILILDLVYMQIYLATGSS